MFQLFSITVTVVTFCLIDFWRQQRRTRFRRNIMEEKKLIIINRKRRKTKNKFCHYNYKQNEFSKNQTSKKQKTLQKNIFKQNKQTRLHFRNDKFPGKIIKIDFELYFFLQFLPGKFSVQFFSVIVFFLFAHKNSFNSFFHRVTSNSFKAFRKILEILLFVAAFFVDISR